MADSPMTADDLDKLEKVLRKATPSPWWWTGYGSDRINIVKLGATIEVLATMNGTSKRAIANSSALLTLVNAAPELIRLARLAVLSESRP